MKMRQARRKRLGMAGRPKARIERWLHTAERLIHEAMPGSFLGAMNTPDRQWFNLRAGK